MSLVPHNMEKEEETGEVGVNALVPFMGCCCCFSSCYLEWPDCIGCSGKQACLCLECDFLQCKVGKEEDIWCVCSKATILCRSPDVCLMMRTQNFCLDIRASLPPVEEIPCMINFCFLTICYKSQTVCSCCNSIETLEGVAAN